MCDCLCAGAGIDSAAVAAALAGDELAREGAMSRSAFMERFTMIVGETSMRYLAKQRLLAATQKLRDSTYPISRIEFEVGYDSESSFNRAFRRVYAMPPAEWRKAKA